MIRKPNIVFVFLTIAFAFFTFIFFFEREKQKSEGLLLSNKLFSGFQNLPQEEMSQFVIKERDYGIAQAQERGEYRCCVEPPSVMCYMEANEWNNFTAGTCVCDDLITQGKEPCPQCKKEGCLEEQGACQIK